MIYHEGAWLALSEKKPPLIHKGIVSFYMHLLIGALKVGKYHFDNFIFNLVCGMQSSYKTATKLTSKQAHKEILRPQSQYPVLHLEDKVE